MKFLERVANWKTLCVFLLDDFDGYIVRRIEKSNHHDVEGCRAAMIREFLKRGECTWEKVLWSLRRAGFRNLASDIENQLIVGSTETPLTQG